MYVQSDTLLLADVFDNFQNMCLKICELDPSKFLSPPGFSMESSFKKDNSKIRSFNWYPYVINGKKKGIRRGICYSIYLHTKSNNKYMKEIMIKIKNRYTFNIGM